MSDRLTPADRARVVRELDALAFNLNAISVALDVADARAAADILNGAAEKIAAACWVLSAPTRDQCPAQVELSG